MLLPPDAERVGALGELGPFGVSEGTRSLGGVDTDVYRPFLDGDEAAVPRAAFLFVQGGFVTTERYAWIAMHVASRGSVAIVPHTLFDLAFFSQDAPAKSLAGARAASADSGDTLFGLLGDAPAVIAGHSLGGVVAAKSWNAAEPTDVSSLALLASEPDGADVFVRAGRVISLVGSRDEKETVAKAVAGAAAFPDADVVVVDGMNHYQLTDDPSDSELSGDGAASVERDVARQLVLTFVDALIDDADARAAYPFADATAWPAGTSAP